MTTILELQQIAIDLEYRVNQERQAAMADLDALRGQINAVRSHTESAIVALNNLSDVVERMFADRTEALTATIGAPPPTPTNVGVIGHHK